MKHYIIKHIKPLSFSILFTLFASVSAVAVQFIKGDVLDFALAGNTGRTLQYGAALCLFILGEIFFSYLYDLFRGKYSVFCSKDLRQDYFQSILKRKESEFLKKKQGDYIAVYTNEIELVNSNYLAVIPLLGEIILRILFVGTSLFLLDYRVAVLTLFLLTTPLYIPKLAERRLQTAQKESIDAFENHLGKVVEWLSGFELIKNYSIEKIILNKFITSNSEVSSKAYNMRKQTYLSKLISTALSYFSHLIILIFAAYLVLEGSFTAGSFFVAVSMIDQLSYPIITLSEYLQDILAARPVGEELAQYLLSSKATGNKFPLEGPIEQIEYRKVAFAYPGCPPVLLNFNLCINGNESCIIQGRSGGGKSTCMSLLLEYYTPMEGSITINGKNVSEIGNLQDIITIMRQDTILFEDSLRNNLTVYQEIPDEVLIDMLHRVGLDTFASREGLDSHVAEHGANYSGGEQRRIAFARTLLRPSPILILDEPLANLDTATASLLEEEILSIKDRMVILVTHQFSEEKLGRFDRRITVF